MNHLIKKVSIKTNEYCLYPTSREL